MSFITRHCPARRLSARRGFTLIEIMITLALLAIISMLAMPAFNTWVANSRVRAVGSDLADGLRLAQAESLRRNRQTVFVLTNFVLTSDANPATFPNYTATSSGNNWAVSLAPSTLGDKVFVRAGSIADIGKGVIVTGQAAICFSALGRLVANDTNTGINGASCSQPTTISAFTYQIAMPGVADHPLQVEVGLGGQVRLCNPAQDAAPNTPEGCQFRS